MYTHPSPLAGRGACDGIGPGAIMVTMLEAMWKVSLDLGPWLLVGAALSGALHALLPPDFLRQHLRGRGGVVKAVLLGVPLPLCSCGVIPAGLGLRRDGASPGASLGFLIATPQTGVDSMVVSASMLGWPFAVFKVLAAFVTGIAGGLATDRWAGEQGGTPPPAAGQGEMLAPAWRRGLDHSTMVVQSIWHWLLIGVVVSAALDVFVPASLWARVSGWNPGLSMLAALLVSVPLYVCATASVPIAAGLVTAGLPVGAALVFLMAGPATNVATIGAIRRALGGRAAAIYLATVILGSFAFGFAFDLLVSGGLAALPHRHGEGIGWITHGLAGVFWIMLAYFGFMELRSVLGRRRARAHQVKKRGGTVHDVQVAGLTCQGCVRKLEQVLASDEEVDMAQVTLEPQRAHVHGRLHAGRLRELVERAGYHVVE